MTLKSEAWDRVVEANEFWDGEASFRRAARRRFDAEWEANGPSVVSVNKITAIRAETTTHKFATRREAEAFASKEARDSTKWITVAPDREAVSSGA